jgi:hypothetical protein
VATLDVPDTIVHLALHAAISGGHRLVWLVDLAMTIASDPPNWDAVVDRARRGRVALPVAAMLHRAATTVDAAIPEGLTNRLVGPVESALVRRLGTWRPNGRLPGGASPDRAVSRSLRSGLGSTTIRSLREASAMGRRLVDPTEWWAETSDPRHVMHAAGTRSEYVASIAGVDRFGNTA